MEEKYLLINEDVEEKDELINEDEEDNMNY